MFYLSSLEFVSLGFMKSHWCSIKEKEQKKKRNREIDRGATYRFDSCHQYAQDHFDRVEE